MQETKYLCAILTNYANNLSTNDCQMIMIYLHIDLGTVVVSLFLEQHLSQRAFHRLQPITIF